MKRIYLFFALLIPYFSIAQVPDRTETDCDLNSRSIYAVGDAGKPLIIASKGFDCSICMNQAAAVENFAADNIETIEVWGAMTYTYSNTEPDCEAVNGWEDTYNWENIFAYADVDDVWLETGTPRYYVIHPISHEIAYDGASFTQASNTALSLVTVTGVDNSELNLTEFTVFSDGEMVQASFGSEVSGNATVEILNIVGQQSAVFTQTVNTGLNRFGEGFTAAPGIYLFKVSLSGKVAIRKFVVARV